jgi:hypothetical protein
VPRSLDVAIPKPDWIRSADILRHFRGGVTPVLLHLIRESIRL